jgi:hypothetical protein
MVAFPALTLFHRGDAQMAQLSLGELKWRMIRRVVRKKKFQYLDIRNMTRTDEQSFAWFLQNGFVTDKGDGWYELTERGKGAAELGLYEI